MQPLSLSSIVEVSAFRGGGFEFHNDAPRSFGAGDLSHVSSTFSSGAFGQDISSSNGYRDVNSVGAGNKYTGNYYGSTTATNAWGQTYHSDTYVHNGNVYHGAVVNESGVRRISPWGWIAGDRVREIDVNPAPLQPKDK